MKNQNTHKDNHGINVHTISLGPEELSSLMSCINASSSGHFLSERILEELGRTSSASYLDVELFIHPELSEAFREECIPFIRLSTDSISSVIKSKCGSVFIISGSDTERAELIIDELMLFHNDADRPSDASKKDESGQDENPDAFRHSERISDDDSDDVSHSAKPKKATKNKRDASAIHSLGSLSSNPQVLPQGRAPVSALMGRDTADGSIRIRPGLGSRTSQPRDRGASANPLFKKYSDHVIARTTPSRPYVSTATGYARMLAMSSLLPSETEGGRGAQMVIGVASPVGSYIAARFIQQGVSVINRDICFDKTTYLNAYAVYSYKVLKYHPESYTDPEEIMARVNSTAADGHPNMDQAGLFFNRSDYPSFAHMIQVMNQNNLQRFLTAQKVSESLSGAIAKYGMGCLRSPAGLTKLIPFITSEEDLLFIEMLKASQLSQIYNGTPMASLIRSFSKRAVMRGIGRSEGAMGIRKLMGIERTMRTVYKLGLKMAAGIAEKKYGSAHIITKSLRFARSPVRHMVRHSFRITKRTAAIRKGSLLVRAKKLLGAKLFSHAATSGTAAASSAAAGSVTAASASAAAAGTTASTGSAATAGSTAAGTAGGISAGAVIAIIIAIIMILSLVYELIIKNTKDKDYKPQSPSIYVDNTQMVQEIVTELEGYNTSFNQQINDARNHRGAYAMSEGFKDSDSASDYEDGAYAVIFRDGYGNELDPETVDFNNTKTILAMASTYFPYPFYDLPEGATKNQREVYEQKKQYFFDYCRYLWVSTHRIDIEEYYPGDSNYSDVDDSGMVTDKGTCDMNGKRIWLPEDMEPDYVSNTVCPDCNEDLATGMGISSHALCTHPDETYISADGWKKTGNTKVHYNCPDGHRHGSWTKDEDGWTDNTYYTYCCEGNVENPNHKHVSYEWEYVCGGHMGAVVYVTIGNTSRLTSMPAANDIDYGTVASYKEE